MGCEGTLATWDLATVLGRTSQDIPGYSEAVHHIFGISRTTRKVRGSPRHLCQAGENRPSWFHVL